MEPVTVLVIEEGAEAALVCAALARQPDVRVLDAPDVRRVLKRLDEGPGRAVGQGARQVPRLHPMANRARHLQR